MYLYDIPPLRCYFVSSAHLLAARVFERAINYALPWIEGYSVCADDSALYPIKLPSSALPGLPALLFYSYTQSCSSYPSDLG